MDAHQCPKCGSENVAEILWGLPMFSPTLEKDLEESKDVYYEGLCSSNAVY